jgi:7-cyano-7-deazaguanine synthase
MIPDKALVILSGGQDSVYCLFGARARFKEIYALTFDYGQRHREEIEAAKIVARMAGVASHEIVPLGPILRSSSPLVDHSREIDLPPSPDGIESSFVPGRNALFLTLAANRAAALGIRHLIIGVCEADDSGYPDCRGDFIRRMELALSYGFFGIKDRFRIMTPLLDISKAEAIQEGMGFLGYRQALAFSMTCYEGSYPPCGRCHSCRVRAQGFHDAGVMDPLILRAKREGLLPADYPDTGLIVGEER